MLSWAAKELALRLELKNYSREKSTVEPTMGRGWPRLCRADGVWGFKSDLPPPTQTRNSRHLLEVRKH